MDALPLPDASNPAVVQSAGSQSVSADQLLSQIKRRLPATKFLGIKPSTVQGLYTLTMEEGKVGYTDKTGRYFIVGVIFDTLTGDALDNQLTGSNTGDTK